MKDTYGWQAEPGFALVFRLQRGAENSRQITDLLGDQIIVFHEPFDAARASPVPVTQQPRYLGLQVESQAILAAPCEKMQLAADIPKKPLGPVKTVRFFFCQHPPVDNVRNLVDLV